MAKKNLDSREAYNRLTDQMHGRPFRIYHPEASSALLTGGRLDLPDTPNCTDCSDNTVKYCAARGITEGQPECRAWSARLNARRPGQN